MSKEINPTCLTCDYFSQCNRTFEYKGTEYVAKEQAFLRMKCLNSVQEICRDCTLFHEKRCAAWQTVNGKIYSVEVLTNCPKKVTGEMN